MKELVFTPYEVKPEIINRLALARHLDRHYPVPLRDAGVGGTTVLWTLVDSEGNVRATQLARSSRYVEIDQAAASVIAKARFSPAVLGGCRTAVWIDLPITFAVADRPTR